MRHIYRIHSSQFTRRFSVVSALIATTLVFSVLYGVLAVLITCVNVVIITIFSRRKFRHKQSNLLLLGLAVVDLTIGSLKVPLLIVNLRSSNDHVGLTSIFTLAVISLERMCAVCWPFRYRTLDRHIYIFAACIPWILAISGTIVAELANNRTVNRVLISCSMVLPLITICSAYLVVWKKKPGSLQHQSAVQEAQERNNNNSDLAAFYSPQYLCDCLQRFYLLRYVRRTGNSFIYII